MKGKNKISKGPILIAVAVILICVIVVFLVQRMEGQPPKVSLTMSSAALGSNSSLELTAVDEKTGLRRLWVAVQQEGRETVLLDKVFPSAGPFAGGLVHEEKATVAFDPKAADIKDGKATLRIMARDFSWRKWMKGNQFYQEQEITVDTRAPEINVVSKVHYLAQGGAGLVIYRLSEPCVTSGVQVGDHFYPGYSGEFSDKDLFMAFIAVANDQPTNTPVAVTAVDLAGNQGRSGLAYRINSRRFKSDNINLSDGFLDQKMPEFRNQVGASAADSNLDVYLKVNGDLRQSNYETLRQITAHCDNKLYWQGAFSRLPGAANRAGFADRRTYVYKGKKVDQQTHLGIDLASLAHSPVPAANAGKVVFTDVLGIYGKTVIIDHGFGLFSMYSHLSQIDVTNGQMVNQNDIIAKTGMTGLAGGDHLHYSILVHDTFVNPLEWWDSQWINNNITEKIKSAQS